MNDNLSLLNDIYCFESASVGIYTNYVRAMVQYQVSGDRDILMEGASDMVSKIAESIRKLIDAIKRFFVNFIRMFTNAMLSYKDFCKKYQSELSSWNGSFKYTGYQFKVLKSKDPNMDCFRRLVDSYNSALTDFSKLKIDTLKNDAQNALSDDHLNEIRAQVLGVSGAIERDDFVKTVREAYRGSEDEEEFTVDHDYVSDAVAHAETLTEMKKKAEKDRDAIINLLSKAEIFFGRKVNVIYKGSNKYVDTKQFDYDSSDYRTKSDDNESTQAYTEDAVTKANMLVTLKYNQTKAYSSIINIVVTERANALKDMLKQENTIVRKALARVDKSDADDDHVSEAIDYVDMVQCLEYAQYPEMESAMLANVNREYDWIMDAFESGDMSDCVIMEGIVKRGIEFIKETIGKIIRSFREKGIVYKQQYAEWYNNEDVQATITKAAESHDMTLVPMWKGNYGSTQIGNLTSMLKAIDVDKIDDGNLQWANKFVSVKTVDDLKQDNLKEKLLSYFMAGNKDRVDTERVKLNGQRLSAEVTNMFKYLNEYDSLVKASSQIETTLKAMKSGESGTTATGSSVTKPVSDAFGSDSYSTLLGCYVAESDLGILMEETKESGIGNNNSGVAAGAAGSADEKKNGESVVKPVENENKNVADKADDSAKKEPTKDGLKEDCLRFAQACVSAYVTSLENRFVLYFNTINDCAPADYKAKAWLDKYAKDSTTPTENVPAKNKKKK